MKRQLIRITFAALFIYIVNIFFSGCAGQIDFTNLSANQLFERGMEKYEKKKYLTSIEIFQTITYNHRGASLIDSAQYYLALSYYGNRDYILAGVEFNRLLISYPSSIFATQSQLMKAICAFEGTPRNSGLDQSDLEIAIRQFEDFIIDHPESDSFEDAKAYLMKAKTRLAKKMYESAIVYIYLRDYRAATIYLQKVIDDFIDTEYASMASFKLAEVSFKKEEWSDAYEAFEKFLLVFPEHLWHEKASEYKCKSAFLGGSKAMESEDYVTARKHFERFKSSCIDDKGKLEKIEKMLKQMESYPVADAAEDNAGS